MVPALLGVRECGQPLDVEELGVCTHEQQPTHDGKTASLGGIHQRTETYGALEIDLRIRVRVRMRVEFRVEFRVI